jgi:hypothetical protein
MGGQYTPPTMCHRNTIRYESSRDEFARGPSLSNAQLPTSSTSMKGIFRPLQEFSWSAVFIRIWLESIFFFSQNITAFSVLYLVSPVSYSVCENHIYTGAIVDMQSAVQLRLRRRLMQFEIAPQVANTTKRIVVITTSLFVFGNEVSFWNVVVCPLLYRFCHAHIVLTV